LIFFRYLAEFLDDEECAGIVEKALQLYSESDKAVKNYLPSTHPLRLGHQLNLSVFYYEVLQEPGKAMNIAKTALEEAFANIDKINEASVKVRN